ncbi:hypothetical protein PENTCL1PPCAC_21195, partial [Pristionchus entomophagus]
PYLSIIAEKELMLGVLRVDSVHEQRIGSVQLDVRLVRSPGRMDTSIISDVLSLRAYSISAVRTAIGGKRAELGILIDHALSHGVESILGCIVHPAAKPTIVIPLHSLV